MTLSFAALWEKTKQHKTFMENSESLFGDDDSTSPVVLAKQKPEFLRELAETANSNSLALGTLLGIEPGTVARWYPRIKEALKSAERARAETQQSAILSTGV